MRKLLFALSALALAACGQSPVDSDITAPGAAQPVEAPAESVPGEGDTRVQPEMDALDRMGDACGMAPFRRYLGQPASDIPQADLPARARIVGPGSRVTMDYAPRRLNILTDEAGAIIGFKCG